MRRSSTGLPRSFSGSTLRFVLLEAMLLSPIGVARSHAFETIPVTISEGDGGLTAELHVASGPAWTLDLQPRSYRSDAFTVFLDVGGSLTPFDAPPLPTYSGVIAGVPEHAHAL